MPRLRTVSPKDPGWTRRRAGKGFVYLDQLGRRLAAEDRERCKLLVIPPAWEQVWICPAPNGHLQAVGTDDAGRRQYIYHEQWRINRDKSKHDRVLTVAERLPLARHRVIKDLKLDGMPRERALATAFRLLDLGFFRIGGEAYAETNNSYGLATVRKEHVTMQGGSVIFEYTAKSGQERYVALADDLVGASVRQLLRAAPWGRPGTACLQGKRALARRQLVRHQRVHQGQGRRRGLGQGLPHLARHGDRGGRAGGREREGAYPDRPQARRVVGDEERVDLSRQHACSRAEVLRRSAGDRSVQRRGDDLTGPGRPGHRLCSTGSPTARSNPPC